MSKLIQLWRGELPLVHAFWNWAFSGGLIVNTMTSTLFLVLVANDHPVLALIAGYAPSIPYNIIAAVGVWRSAERYQGDRQWADLARVVTIAGMVVLSLT